MSETAPHAAQTGSLFAGWPALLMTVFVSVAAVISFSHRPLPPFPATQIHPDQLLVNGLAQQGDRLVAVGEQGRILYADLPGKSWRVAKVEPQRGSNLNNVLFTDQNTVIAIGHDGWILRSEDGGKNWQEVHFDTGRSEPLLGVAGPYDGTLFAFGAFGLFLTSTDGGKTWQPSSLVEAPKATDPAAATVTPEAAPAEVDVFAMTDVGGGISDRHFNGMTRAGDGSLVIVGERGLIAQSTDSGKTWTALPEIYQGSFYGVLALPGNGLLVYGMRGNAYYSTDLGKTWQKSDVPQVTSLFGGAVNSDGSILLAGTGNSIYVSSDGGVSFRLVSRADRKGLAAILPMEGSKWLTAGEGGLSLQSPAAR